MQSRNLTARISGFIYDFWRAGVILDEGMVPGLASWLVGASGGDGDDDNDDDEDHHELLSPANLYESFLKSARVPSHITALCFDFSQAR